MVLPSRKELSSKADGFQERENPFPVAGIKDLLKNTFPLYGKSLWFVPEMKHSLKNTFPLCEKAASSGKKKSKMAGK